MTTCEEVRISLGALALGALEPDEELEIDLHLATCPECGVELDELAGVSAFLAKVSEQEVEQVARPPRQVLDRLLSARARRHRRARLLLVAAASAAVIVAGGTVWNSVQGPSGGSSAAPAAAGQAEESSLAKSRMIEPPVSGADASKPAASADDAPAPSDVTRAVPALVFTGRTGGIKATVTVMPGNPTSVTINLKGVPRETRCRLVVVGRDGFRQTAGTWIVRSAGYVEDGAWAARTVIDAKQITRFEIVDDDGATVVVAEPEAG